MTAPFNRAEPTRAPIDGGREPASRPARRDTRNDTRRAPIAALALAGVAAAALGLPVLADASGDGSAAFVPGQTRANTPASAETAAPLRCEIALDALPGGTRIAATVHSDRPVTGAYRMDITSRSAGGRATIRQSGAFEATPDTPAILGETRLMGSPASQDVDLSVTVEGTRLHCGPPAL